MEDLVALRKTSMRSLGLAVFVILTACQGPDLSGTTVHNSGDPLGSPSGRNGTISGRVLSQQGAPLADIPLYLEMLSPPFTSDQVGRASLSDGSFEISLPPGRYLLEAKKLDGAVASAAVTVSAAAVTSVELQFDG